MRVRSKHKAVEKIEVVSDVNGHWRRNMKKRKKKKGMDVIEE